MYVDDPASWWKKLFECYLSDLIRWFSVLSYAKWSQNYLKLGSKKWSKVSVSPLHINDRVPSVSLSHGIDPSRPKLPMTLTCVCIRVTKSGYSLAKNQKWRGGIFSKQAQTTRMSGCASQNWDHAHMYHSQKLPGDSWEWPKYVSYQSENCRK